MFTWLLKATTYCCVLLKYDINPVLSERQVSFLQIQAGPLLPKLIDFIPSMDKYSKTNTMWDEITYPFPNLIAQEH